MNTGIADYIVNLIDTQPWIDKIAGLVTTIETKEKGVTKRFPVACGVQHRDCVAGQYDDLVPNSRYKTVIYFEDGGVTFGKTVKDRKYFTSRLRLVCWINLQKLGETGCTLTTDIILSILRLIPEFPVNSGDYLQLSITPISQPVRTRAIFDKYTFDESTNQYLMSPYDYFAIDINCSWWSVLECITPYVPGAAIACPTQPT